MYLKYRKEEKDNEKEPQTDWEGCFLHNNTIDLLK